MKKLKNILGVFVILMVAVLIPFKVFAEEVPTEFKEILSDDGYLEVDSIPPTTFEQAYLIIDDYVLYERTEGRFGLAWNYNTNSINCNADYTLCDIQHNESGKVHAIKIRYNYDKNVKKIIDEYVKKIEGKNSFGVYDMEVVNFWINAKGDETLVKDYSSELKKYFDFKNFEFDIRQGDPGEFVRSTGGEGNIVYDGTLYHLGGFTEVVANHVLYVPESTGDSKEELMAAIQKRIDNYIGKGVVNVTYGGNVYNYHVTSYDKDIREAEESLALELAKPVDEQDVFEIMYLQSRIVDQQGYKQAFIDSWNTKTGEYAYLTEAEGEYYFYATIPGNAGYENEFKFIVVKDDDKMYEPSHKTTDVNTNVTISSDDSSIPLDTIIKAKLLTSGEEYEKIIKILNLTNSLTFDLKLYSNSLENYITKLEDGTFEVKIPIPEEFKGKDYIVYYVKENGEKEEFTVTPKDGYAIFNTNHFSIYTLAVKESATNNEQTTKPVDVPTNPKTSDNITTYFGLGIISLMGLMVVNKKFKREN